LAKRDVGPTIAGSPIRYRLLWITLTTAALSLLIFWGFLVGIGTSAAAGLSPLLALVAAAVAGTVMAAPLWLLVTRPVGRLNDRLAELHAARREAEAASAAKSDFLGNMSHELRNGLNAIIGFSDLMKGQTLGPIGNPTYVDYAVDINFSGTHLLEIVNDILDVVRYDAVEMELKEEAVAVACVVEEALRLVTPQAQQSGIELSWSPPTPAPQLYCDRVRLRQILVNILSNAIKFTKPGGSVAITVVTEAGLAIVVRDNGIGIRPQDIARILRPFGQIASPDTRGQAGAGLGLTVTKALLERHGGRLNVDSAPGAGTTVRLWFPPERVLQPGRVEQRIR
jgi:signal transduction histidine kinase